MIGIDLDEGEPVQHPDAGDRLVVEDRSLLQCPKEVFLSDAAPAASVDEQLGYPVRGLGDIALLPAARLISGFGVILTLGPASAGTAPGTGFTSLDRGVFGFGTRGPGGFINVVQRSRLLTAAAAAPGRRRVLDPLFG